MLIRILFFLMLFTLARWVWRVVKSATEPSLDSGSDQDSMSGESRHESLTDQAIEDADYEELP